MRNHGNYVASLDADRPLARRARRGARRDDRAGDVAPTKLLVSAAASSASAPATRGAARTARSSRTSSPGSDIVARVTILAEGTQGHLTGAALERFGLAGRSPQVWALGVKEVWEVAQAARPGHPHDGLAAAAAGSTASSAAASSTRWATTCVTLGIVVGLDYTRRDALRPRPAPGAEDAPARAARSSRAASASPGARRRSPRAASCAAGAASTSRAR